ncbi:MAG: hypothetical protein QOF28_2267 [Actinomycetota bacterium]|jgi:uncharacterized protein YndB with AHSA1/START domain|nr:hypothetical protein [Actinomycetota bacterium]
MAEPIEDVNELAVERTAELAAPPEAVWDAITDPELLAEWFGPLEFDLSPGGVITTSDAGETETIGVVEGVDPPHRIGFVWVAPGSESPSSVEIVIDDDERGGSILRTREVRLETDWERRPAWFPSIPRARVSARA